ncbi:hypothetical protein KEM52_003455 [Ascosphaera acerosa]|nr:hypothetical protein KEM52_003455 [Ascosphaera acerosa]
MAIRWIPALNDRAGDEIKAHTAMFSESGNPRFHQLADEAVDQIVRWVDVEWYRSSEAGVATARRAVANQARPRGQAQSRSRSSAATKG